ncbi:MAG: hypothetical protein ACFFCM_16870 [Promethearchaeota archaeon]
MAESENKNPDLLWSCFINWLNTLEKVLSKDPDQKKSLKEHLGID